MRRLCSTGRRHCMTWEKYQKAQSKQVEEQQQKELNEKLGVRMKWEDEVILDKPRDPEKARGTVLEKVVLESRKVGQLPDDENIQMMKNIHPAMPSLPDASGEWFLSNNETVTSEEVITTDDVQVKLQDVRAKKNELDQIRTENRIAYAQRTLDKMRKEAAASNVDLGLLENEENLSVSPSTEITQMPTPDAEPVKVAKAPMHEIPFDRLPPLPDYPHNSRMPTGDEVEFIHESTEKRDEATQRIYDDVYGKWKALKKLEIQRKKGIIAEEQNLTEEERKERTERRIKATQEREEAQKQYTDPLEALEREMYPERYETEEDIRAKAEEMEEKKRKARVNLKPIPNTMTLHLKKTIQMRGPIPISEFMKEALLNPEYGYYTTKKKVLGRDGDFITSPEVSQMFGECIAAWAVDTYEKLGKPQQFHLIELGGGKGTLLSRVLKATENFPEFQEAMRVGMVEVSPSMIEAQKETIAKVNGGKILEKISWADDVEGLGIHDDLAPIICFSNELFDVFAVSKFQYTERGWCEWMVEVDDDPEHPEHFKFVLSSGETAGSITFLPHDIRKMARDNRLLGKTIEVQMQGYLYLERLLTQITRSKGTCLVIDYGVDDYVEDSLRGIKGHEFVHPLTNPGEVDLSGFVSFKMLRDTVSRSAKLSGKIHCTSVMNQGEFLKKVGIEARALTYLCNVKNVRDAAKVAREFTMLTDEEDSSGMGIKFKAMCFSSKQPSGLIPPCPW
eukprot:TRINITY_DN3382_c0_g1_i1.p1 TRINITY_DN3382_c0_g1~~TRINITY_DN3382_c0_g1_i1.p1  ORF type:complete len:756 (+),score=160.10 TRINITY_DN3382_c0_g1_i1:69-2270(+)